jgi:hypothetical protein
MTKGKYKKERERNIITSLNAFSLSNCISILFFNSSRLNVTVSEHLGHLTFKLRLYEITLKKFNLYLTDWLQLLQLTLNVSLFI